MIQATELRIGNYVEIDAFNVPRLGIQRDTFMQITGGGIFKIEQGLLEIKPIQLTEEWLIKFGFNFMTDTLFQKPWFNIIKDNDGFNYEKGGGWLLKIKHVHSLQNLYFAICGKELTIKE